MEEGKGGMAMDDLDASMPLHRIGGDATICRCAVACLHPKHPLSDLEHGHAAVHALDEQGKPYSTPR